MAIALDPALSELEIAYRQEFDVPDSVGMYLFWRDHAKKVMDRDQVLEIYRQAIEEHDCGQIPSKKVPHQAHFHSTKPLLRQLIKEFDWRDLWLFLEVKSRPEWDDLYHPNPHEYSDLIVGELADFEHLNMVYFMSFDSRILELIQSKIPNSKNLLLFDQMPSEKIQFNSIGPNHKLITRENLRNWKMQKLEVFAWTVNELEDIQKCKSGGIDGIISDYPNRLFG